MLLSGLTLGRTLAIKDRVANQEDESSLGRTRGEAPFEFR